MASLMKTDCTFLASTLCRLMLYACLPQIHTWPPLCRMPEPFSLRTFVVTAGGPQEGWACRDDAEATGEAAWVGYIGPFKARSDSVDMAGGMAGWQGWPMEGMYGRD